LEDYDDEGFIPIHSVKEAFTSLGIELEQDLLDYILYVLYQKSESADKLKYSILIDLIDGKVVLG
jgi:hypothetical protein